jgi:5,10-methylenetetrahydrofolate reductase
MLHETIKQRKAFGSGLDLVKRLQDDDPVWAIELRPPRRKGKQGGLEPWIDLYHAVRRLTVQNNLVLTTDNALGDSEEENLRHLAANLGEDADLSRVVPFLTAKHSLEYCLRFPERAHMAGHRALVVLGGDKHDGVRRCVPHAAELRELLRQRQPGMALGGWANPYRNLEQQTDLLLEQEEHTDFYLTQIVSHHQLKPIEQFLTMADKRGLRLPPMVGVFYYRSGRKRTLETLSAFMPVPVDGLRKDFAEAEATAMDICARTIRELRQLGIRHIYLCNLAAVTASRDLNRLKQLTQ